MNFICVYFSSAYVVDFTFCSSSADSLLAVGDTMNRANHLIIKDLVVVFFSVNNNLAPSAATYETCKRDIETISTFGL
jgi:hypothetical protein